MSKTPGTILADGQCHYAFQVEAEPGQGRQVVAALKSWKTRIRTEGFAQGSIEALCNDVCSLSGVARVIPTGPRSALPLALRMACGLSGRRGVFTSHNGRGLLSDSIRDGLNHWNIDLHVLRMLDGDMPGAFMVVDPNHPDKHETALLRPLSSSRYKHQSLYPDNVLEGADAMLLNRVNQGLLRVAEKSHQAGKVNSQRIHGYSRHVHFDDYRPMLPLIDHLVIDSGHHSLRDTARRLDLNPPRGWPDNGPFDPDFLRRISNALDEIAGRSLLHAYVINGRDTIHLLGKAGQTSVTIRPKVPAGRLCDVKTTARAHGALLAAVLLNKPEFDLDPSDAQPKSQKGLDTLANWVFRATYHGIYKVPWEWPGVGFSVE